MRITLPGPFFIKKNTAKQYGKYTVYSKKYQGWHKSALRQLQKYARPKIALPVNLCCLFYRQDRRRCDLSNLYEGVQDVLVEAGILEDDNYNIVAGHDGSRVYYDKENPRIEITIKYMSDGRHYLN